MLKASDFINEMCKVATESKRVLKRGKILAIMIGDCRKNKKVVPLGFELMKIFLEEGFKLKEIIIKEQFNCTKSKYWESKNLDFLLLAHEYIFVFEKG